MFAMAGKYPAGSRPVLRSDSDPHFEIHAYNQKSTFSIAHIHFDLEVYSRLVLGCQCPINHIGSSQDKTEERVVEVS